MLGKVTECCLTCRRKKLGMWSLKKGSYESPAEYKRKHSA